MKITSAQVDFLSSLNCLRVRDLGNNPILDKITGRRNSKGEISGIIDCFRHPDSLAEDIDGHLASFIIFAPNNIPLLFFSLRCGELYEQVDKDRMEIAVSAINAYKILNDKTITLSTEESQSAREKIKKAIDCGISPDEMSMLHIKHTKIREDKLNEPDGHVSRVSKVYGGVELKFFGVTEEGRSFWQSTGINKPVGQTLFWRFIIDKIEDLQNICGCSYLYLFAADTEPDGKLVTYYREALSMNAEDYLTANKPSFDYTCMFLYQRISELRMKRNSFFETFNSAKDTPV